MGKAKATSKDKWDLLVELYLEDMVAVLRPLYPQIRKNKRLNGRELLSTKERNCVDGFQRFIEITHSLESLDLILKLAARRPARAQAEPMKALRFYIEAYLQETYILRERLIRWLRFEKKLVPQKSNQWNLMKTAEETVREAFNGPNTVRSAHVHEIRHDTEDLSWASSLELIARTRAPNNAIERMNWHVVAEMKYKECRAEFIANKSAERKMISQLLNGLALIAQPIVELRR